MHFGLRALRWGVFSTFFTLGGGVVMADASGHESAVRDYNLAHGRVVFTQHCLRCHEKGRKGAPKSGDVFDWSPRLDQPLRVLIAHAIEGHGDMPARGKTELSDQEIAAAVAYVVSRAEAVLGDQAAGTRATNTDTGIARVVEAEPFDAAVVRMFLLLMGKERWK